MSDGTQRLVDGGRVTCLRASDDVDIEHCYACSWVRGLQHRKNGEDTVYCGFRGLKTLWD